MRSSSSVLVVNVTADHHRELTAAISNSGLMATSCDTLETAQSLVRQHEFSMMFCEDRLSDLRTIIRNVSHSVPPMPVIVVSRRDDWNSYLNTLRAGAFDCVVLPAVPGELDRIVRAALRNSGQEII